MRSTKQVIVSGVFDDLRARDLRFLQEASRLGAVSALLWSDAMAEKFTGKLPKFPTAERRYFLDAVRYISRVIELTDTPAPAAIRHIRGLIPDVWADPPGSANSEHEQYCHENKIAYRVFTEDETRGFPEPPPMASPPGRTKVIATGCYDWFHSGHVRFVEEASAFGDLYICLGSDENLRLLKGEGHPLLSQAERRYTVGSIKYVKQALIATGSGWLDADPEIRRLKPEIYVVNEDGDKGGKREYCAKLGIQYVVLRREPAQGLAKRSSTELRGF